MFGNEKLKSEVVRLSYRVKDLEERLCPCEQHDFVVTGRTLVLLSAGEDMETRYYCKCKRCGKETSKWESDL